MLDSQDTAKQFFANIDKAQEEICGILFPYLPATLENLAQIQPRHTAAKRYNPNEKIPPILEFDITPNRPPLCLMFCDYGDLRNTTSTLPIYQTLRLTRCI